MRTWLYNRVLAALAGTPFEGHLFSSGGADAHPALFAVLRLGVEQPVLGMPPSMKAASIPLTINLNVPAGESLVDADDTAIHLKSALVTEDSSKVGGITVLNLRWEQTGQDGFDDHWGTDFRPVSFTVMMCR